LGLVGGLGFNVSSENTGSILSSYILGAELDIRIQKHITLNLGMKFFLPSFGQVIEQRTGGSWNGSELNLGEVNTEDPDKQVNAGTITNDIFNFSNFQLLLSLRIYI